MSFLDEAKKTGRNPINIVEIDLDTCSLSYGVSPCAASIGTTGADKCYNTFGTCQDPMNYARSTKTYKFIAPDANVPVGETMFPCLTAVSFAPTRLQFGKGLGYRSTCSITLQDFKHHDRGIDPYASDRTYDTTQGTFFGKLFARNRYYNGRHVRVRTGYISDGVYDVNNFETREYIIESVTGPDSNGLVSISCKDILKKIDNARVKVPEASDGALSADMTDTATSLTLSPAGIGDVYPTSGVVRIGDEIMSYSSKYLDTLSGITRGLYNTTAWKHDKEDTVQLCKVYENENVIDIIYDILVNYAEIDTSYIPYNNDPNNPDEWDNEKAIWLATKNYSTVISKPEGAQTLIEEITEQSLMVMWWSETEKKIKIKAIAPPTYFDVLPHINDDMAIIENSSKLNQNDDDRNTQIWAYYTPVTWAKTKDKEDFKRLYVSADLSKEGENEYGDSRKKVVISRWFGNESSVRNFTGRYLLGTKDALKQISFKADAKELDLDTGDYITAQTRVRQDVTGASAIGQYCIIEKKWITPGHELQYLACESWFQNEKYIYFSDNTTNDYDSATDEEKERYGFISLDDNHAVNGGFDTDLSGWTSSGVTSTWITGGYVDIEKTTSDGNFFQNLFLGRGRRWKVYIDILSAPAGGVSVEIYDTDGYSMQSLSYGNSTGTMIYRTFQAQNVDIGYVGISPNVVGETVRIDNVKIVNASIPVSSGMNNGDEPYLII